MAAPVTAIVAYDPKFYEKLPRLFPHNPDARAWFAGNEALAATTAFRNGTLQGAYLMVAARALGLDCGPMSGFDNAKVDAEFSPIGAGNPTSWSISATATPPAFAPRVRASRSTRPVCCCDPRGGAA